MSYLPFAKKTFVHRVFYLKSIALNRIIFVPVLIFVLVPYLNLSTLQFMLILPFSTFPLNVYAYYKTGTSHLDGPWRKLVSALSMNLKVLLAANIRLWGLLAPVVVGNALQETRVYKSLPLFCSFIQVVAFLCIKQSLVMANYVVNRNEEISMARTDVAVAKKHAELENGNPEHVVVSLSSPKVGTIVPLSLEEASRTLESHNNTVSVFLDEKTEWTYQAGMRLVFSSYNITSTQSFFRYSNIGQFLMTLFIWLLFEHSVHLLMYLRVLMIERAATLHIERNRTSVHVSAERSSTSNSSVRTTPKGSAKRTNLSAPSERDVYGSQPVAVSDKPVKSQRRRSLEQQIHDDIQTGLQSNGLAAGSSGSIRGRRKSVTIDPSTLDQTSTEHNESSTEVFIPIGVKLPPLPNIPRRARRSSIKRPRLASISENRDEPKMDKDDIDEEQVMSSNAEVLSKTDSEVNDSESKTSPKSVQEPIATKSKQPLKLQMQQVYDKFCTKHFTHEIPKLRKNYHRLAIIVRYDAISTLIGMLSAYLLVIIFISSQWEYETCNGLYYISVYDVTQRMLTAVGSVVASYSISLSLYKFNTNMPISSSKRVYPLFMQGILSCSATTIAMGFWYMAYERGLLGARECSTDKLTTLFH